MSTRCTHCGGEAVYFRHYSGEKLCGRCFTQSIEERVRRTISKYNMFKPGDRIAVAVSGGKDSLSLLHILHKLEQRFPKAELLAITVDEGIAGYRMEAVRIAGEKCRDLGVEQHITSFSELFGHTLDEVVKVAGDGLSACSYCGVLRRKALNMAARKVGADKLATAHNLDDEAQTMLMNLAHGDVMRVARVEPALRGDTAGFVPRVKPLSEVLESEVSLYAYLRGIEFQTMPCPYRRTSMRSDVRSFLNRMETRHPGMKYTLLRSLEKVRMSLKSVAVESELRECRICGEPTAGEVCRPCQVLSELKFIKGCALPLERRKRRRVRTRLG